MLRVGWKACIVQKTVTACLLLAEGNLGAGDVVEPVYDG
jgi:hypothetical protein